MRAPRRAAAAAPRARPAGKTSTSGSAPVEPPPGAAEGSDARRRWRLGQDRLGRPRQMGRYRWSRRRRGSRGAAGASGKTGWEDLDKWVGSGGGAAAGAAAAGSGDVATGEARGTASGKTGWEDLDKWVGTGGGGRRREPRPPPPPAATPQRRPAPSGRRRGRRAGRRHLPSANRHALGGSSPSDTSRRRPDRLRCLPAAAEDGRQRRRDGDGLIGRRDRRGTIRGTPTPTAMARPTVMRSPRARATRRAHRTATLERRTPTATATA